MHSAQAGPQRTRCYDQKSMRHSSSTVVVLSGPVPGEVLAAVERSMNVALIRPGDDGDIADSLRRAGRAVSPYALVPADPLADLARSWRTMWDVASQHGPADFEQEAAKALAAWRADQFGLPDYYLVLAAGETGADKTGFHLGPLRSIRPRRVEVVAAEEPADQAIGVLHALGSLRHGPWWPGLDSIIDTARGFYPGSVAGQIATVVSAS
jgi:hypothetical protein